MIREHPAIDLLDLEVFDGIEWVRWTEPLTGVSIQRGGKRDGVTQSVDVGTLTATFVNAGDPLISEVTIPDTEVYRDGFEDGLGSWSGGTWGTTPFRGEHSLDLADDTVTRTQVGGLIPGEHYRLSAWANGSEAAIVAAVIPQTYAEVQAPRATATYGEIGTSLGALSYGSVARDLWVKTAVSTGTGTPFPPTPAWRQLSAEFTAHWDTHTIILSAPEPTYFDHVTVERLAHTVPVPHLRPNRPVRLVATDTRTPVWTGTTNDLDSRYVLDKDTGRKTTYVTLAAVDAVAPLVGTTRYGAVVEGGVGYERWSQRINRLASSAPAGVAVEEVDERLEVEVYAL